MSWNKKLAIAAAFITLSACGGDDNANGASDEYSMQPGTWEVRTWMESNSARGNAADELTQPRKMTRDIARNPVNKLLFGFFYPGKSAENVVANNGQISGSIEQAAVAPYDAHTQTVTGSYDATSFRMVIDLPVMPGGIVQVVEGELVGPLD